MHNGISKAMLIVWSGLGLVIDNIDETQESLIIYISVPKSSFHTHASGQEMSGDFLAKRFKTSMTELGVKRLTVKYKIRPEHWTKEMKEAAELKTEKMLFGSQY